MKILFCCLAHFCLTYFKMFIIRNCLNIIYIHRRKFLKIHNAKYAFIKCFNFSFKTLRFICEGLQEYSEQKWTDILNLLYYLNYH